MEMILRRVLHELRGKGNGEGHFRVRKIRDMAERAEDGAVIGVPCCIVIQVRWSALSSELGNCVSRYRNGV